MTNETFPDFDIAVPLRTRPLWMTLFMLATIGSGLIYLGYVGHALRQAPRDDEPPPEPLEFAIVMEHYGELHQGANRGKVETLIGPPTARARYYPELDGTEEYLEHTNRHIGLPSERIWHKWVDKDNAERWVAIFYAAHYPAYDYHAYSITKRGF